MKTLNLAGITRGKLVLQLKHEGKVVSDYFDVPCRL